MGHRIPLHSNSRLVTPDQKVLHRQAMIQMNPRGFRPNYMEITLVQFGQASPALLRPDRSERSKRKAKARQAYLAKCRDIRAERHAADLSD